MCDRMITQGLDLVTSVMQPQPIDVGTYIKRLVRGVPGGLIPEVSRLAIMDVMGCHIKNIGISILIIDTQAGMLCLEGVTEENTKKVAAILAYYPRRNSILQGFSRVAQLIMKSSNEGQAIYAMALARVIKVVGQEMDDRTLAVGSMHDKAGIVNCLRHQDEWSAVWGYIFTNHDAFFSVF